MNKSHLLMLMILPAFLLTGCGTGADNSDNEATNTAHEVTAEEAVQQIMDGVREGRPVAAWEALPASYQQDVNEIVRTFASNMDPNFWKQAVSNVQQVHDLMVSKQQFILNHPAIAEADDPESARKAVTQLTGLLKTILDTAGDLEKLKSFDGKQFMESTGAQIFSQVDALAKLAPVQPGQTQPLGLAALKDVKIETVESSESEAKLKIIQPDGKSEEQVFVKVEGKWVPKDMAESWKAQIAEAKAALSELPKKTQDMQMGLMMATSMIQGSLAPLQAAETQEQFNEAVTNLQQSVMGLMMGAGGNMGAPPQPEGGQTPGGQPPVESFGNPETQTPEEQPAGAKDE